MTDYVLLADITPASSAPALSEVQHEVLTTIFKPPSASSSGPVTEPSPTATSVPVEEPSPPERTFGTVKTTVVLVLLWVALILHVYLWMSTVFPILPMYGKSLYAIVATLILCALITVHMIP